MPREMLAIVMTVVTAALFVLVALSTWTTAAALGLGPLGWRFGLSLLPLIVTPLIAAALLRRKRHGAATAVLGTAALLWLTIPASALRLLVDSQSGAWTGSALLELAAYGGLALAVTLAVQLVDGRPTPTRPSPRAAVLAAAVLAGAVWPPVVLRGAGPPQWSRPVALTAAGPGDAALLVLVALAIAIALYAGLSIPGPDGAAVLATAAAILLVDHVANLLIVAGDPEAVLAPAGWVGLVGTVGLLLFAAGRIRENDGTSAETALVPDADAA